MERSHRRPDLLRHVLIGVLLIVALVLQVQVLWQTLMMSLGGWSGWSFYLALGQALAGLLVIAVGVGQRRPALVLVVPLVSIVITFGLAELFYRLIDDPYEGDTVQTTTCTWAQEAAIRELVPPNGVITRLRWDNGTCYATLTTTLASSVWRANYEHEFADHGWETTSSAGSAAATAVRDDLRITVNYHADHRTIWMAVDPR